MDAKEHGGYCEDRGDGRVYDDLVQLYRAAGIAVVPTISYVTMAIRMDRPDALDDDAELKPFLPDRANFAWMMELDSTEMMKRFVMAGLGITFLAVSNCREEVNAGKLKAVSLSPEPMVRRLGLIYRKDKALSKAALGFIQVVLEHVGDQARGSRNARVVA